jgi:HEPN domain-containing protein
MEKDVKYWVDLSSYDLRTAGAMLKTGRYVYVLFMCQQAVEKLLKALVVKRTRSFPPKTHDLERLATICSLAPTPEQSELLRGLTAYYIETRYPEDARKIARETGREKSRSYLRRTKEIMAWLRKELL